MKKTILGILSGLLVVSLVFGLTPMRNQGFRNTRGNSRGPGDCHMNDEFYEQHEELFDQNNDKIEALYDDIDDVRDQIEDEVEQDNPDWNKVAKLMEKQHELRNNVWQIRKEERLTILKSLDQDEREEFVENYCFGWSKGHMGPGYQHRGNRGHMGRGSNSGHMMR
ncbi:MAG: hypothetical protein K9M80_05730 [Candidatus Marinimicrobia bacterium]|nr:hypothetical protein [Candidatus Neomarinimicrobiota bacterium]